MALEFAPPRTEMNNRRSFWGKARSARKMDKLPQSMSRLFRKCGILESHYLLWSVEGQTYILLARMYRPECGLAVPKLVMFSVYTAETR
jgi:hypothetical protein